MSDWVEAMRAEWAWPHLGHIVRIFVALVLGGAIGLERELRDKPAGFRTIMLICLGACIFSIVSEVVGGPDFQHTRIAAQIVTGIGFLGAGAILRDRQSVFGLTTAATIWTVAAVGMAVGFGKLALAAAGTVGVLIALWLFDAVEHWIGKYRDIQDYNFKTSNADDSLQRVESLFAQSGLKIRKCNYYQDGDALVFFIIAMGAKPRHRRLRFQLARSEEYTLRRS